MSDPYTHVIFGRACGPDPESDTIQAKVCLHEEPTEEELELVRKGVIETYEYAFDEAPVRVGVAVLPYVESEDGDE